MQYTEQDVKACIEQFYHLYHLQKQEDILPMLTSDFVLSGAIVDREIDGERAIEKIGRMFSTKAQNTKINQLSIEVETCAHFWIVQSTWRLEKDNKTIMFASSFMVVEEDRLKIRKIFVSLEQPNCANQNRVDYLERFVLEKEEVFHGDELTKDIPGGILKCLFDEKLTLIEMSEGFLHICGYTREELKTKFDNSLRALIVEEDFEKTMPEVQEQLKKGPTKKIEYRIRQKSGKEVWLLDKGRLVNSDIYGECFHCIVIDITVEKEMRDMYRGIIERNQIIMNQNDDVIFEWDLKEETISISGSVERPFERIKIKKKASLEETLSDKDLFPIYEEDIVIAKEVVDKIRAGKPYIEYEIRVYVEDGTTAWRRVRVSIQKDENGIIIKAIGIVLDIDEEKKATLSLLEKANKDGLTGMNNKVMTQDSIQKELDRNKNTLGALLLIDIDDFKSVNDTMGHLYGDAVLKDIANVLCSNTRSSDIIGRIGGDEFMMYLKDVKSVENVKEKAQGIVNGIHELESLKKLPNKISCSIGISLYPTHCDDFNTLYKYCDYALYQAKIDGKNRYEVYDEDRIQEYLKCKVNSYTSLINARIDSENSKPWMSDIAQYVFEVLYYSDDIQEAIEKTMEIIGDKYNVSRVYIFENDEDDTHCINSFEWCNHGIRAQKHELQNVSYEELGGNYVENFDERSIFYCSDINTLPKMQYDILAPQGIKSLLQCAIRDKGKFKGFIGFDECNENCYWTQDQVDLLILISEILSIFLLKSRQEEKYLAENEVLLSILDNQNAYIYIIDANTFELLYFNKKTGQAVSGLETNQYCYSALIGCDQPCNKCPAKLVGKENRNATIEFHNEKLGIWSDADASYIHWKGKDAILLVCHDISRFKNEK